MKTFSDFVDEIEKIVKNIYQEEVKKMDIPENVIATLEGPNIIFKSRSIQFRICSMKFLPKSDHKKYKNFLGESGIIFEIVYKIGRNSESEIREKIRRCLKVVESLYKNNVFQEEGSSALIKVES